MSMYQRILVPIDGSHTSNLGLEEAFKLARLTGAQLKLIHVVDPLTFASGFDGYAAYSGDVVSLIREAGEKIVAQGRAKLADAGLPGEAILIETTARRVSDVVDEEAKGWKADLIVIGTHGRRGVRRALMGSDAEQIARSAPAPVLLVRGPEGSEA